MPLTQQIAFELLDELDLPPGVVNLVNGGREVVEGILDHPGIDAVSFVGSAPVARIVYDAPPSRASAYSARRGQEPHGRAAGRREREDRRGLDRVGVRRGRPALPGGSGGRYRRRGPESSRQAAARGVRPPARGDGLDDGRSSARPVSPGPAPAHPRRPSTRPSTEGASLAVDGRERAGDNGDGCFVGPTMFDDVGPGYPTPPARRSSAPCSSVVRAAGLNEAIEIVDAPALGNSVSLFTQSGVVGPALPRRGTRPGMLGVNLGGAGAGRVLPLLRLEGSLLGDLHADCADAVAFYTRKKTVTSRRFSSGQGTGPYFVES